jgi:hypothetical protein
LGTSEVRTIINVPFLPLVPTVADEMRKRIGRVLGGDGVTNARFRGQSGHDADTYQCPLLTQSGHERFKIGAVQYDR